METLVTTDGLMLWRHRRAGFAIPLPRDWHIQEDPRADVALIAVAPESDDFRPNIVVTVDELEPDRTLQSWQEFTDSASEQLLDQYLLIDTEVLERHGHPIARRLAHHPNADGVALTMEQWSTVRGRLGYTVTATAQTMGLQYVAGLFAAVARGFRTDDDIEETEA